MAVITRLEPQRLDPAAELEAFSRGRMGDGAIVSFTGLVRGVGPGGEAVSALILDWYPGLTDASLTAIGEAAASRFAVSDILIVHRVGTVAPGAPVVLAAAAAPHRRDAFSCVDQMMDRLKTDLAVWKREGGPDGDRWIEPLPTDRADRARWS